MATTEKVETKETVNVEELKNELEQVKSERDQYKQAYEQVAEQNTNVWGMYSNLIDYVAIKTIRKQNR